MTIAEVRQTLKDFLDKQKIQGVSQVYAANPRREDGSDIVLDKNLNYSAIVFLEFPSSQDNPLSAIAGNLNLVSDISTRINFIYKYRIKDQKNQSDWIGGFDNLTNELLNAIRFNPSELQEFGILGISNVETEFNEYFVNPSGYILASGSVKFIVKQQVRAA